MAEQQDRANQTERTERFKRLRRKSGHQAPKSEPREPKRIPVTTGSGMNPDMEANPSDPAYN